MTEITPNEWVLLFFGSLIWVYIASRLWYSGLLVTLSKLVDKITIIKNKLKKQLEERENGTK